MMQVLIVGAGPAGLAVASFLHEQGFPGRIQLVERGRGPKRRVCPVDRRLECTGCGGTCNVLSGFGGCIHYGDAVKLSELPSGRRLYDILGQAAERRMAESRQLIEKTLGEPVIFCAPQAPAEASTFKPYPVAVLTARQVRRFLDAAWERLATAPGVELRMKTEILELSPAVGGGYRAVLQEAEGAPETVRADVVFVAVGRAGLFWWHRTLRELGLTHFLPKPSVGLRFEMKQNWLQAAAAVHPDYKVTLWSSAGKFKSFCFCAGSAGGRLKSTDYGDFCLLDGHVASAEDELPEERTAANFALLHQLADLDPDKDPLSAVRERFIEPYRALRPGAPGHPVAQRFGDFRWRRPGPSSWSELRATLLHRPSIEDLAPACIDQLFDDVVHRGFCDAAERFLGAVLAHGGGAEPDALERVLVVALELEGLWDVMEVDLHFETSRPGLFVVGDAAGIAQGILQAMATGVAAARRVVELPTTASQSHRDRLVYDRYWTVNDHYQPSETFVRMVERLLAPDRSEVRIADLGCGIGRHTLYAASRGVRVIAVDHSSRAVARLRERIDDLPIEVLEGDLLEWVRTHPQAGLDGLVCFDAIHHLGREEKEVVAALEGLDHTLRPGGLLLITLLADIDYGLGGAPAGRLLVSADRAEELLDTAFAAATLLHGKRTAVRFEHTVNLDPVAGRMVPTHYQATRVLRLFRMPGR